MVAKSLRLDIGFDTTDLLALADDLARFDPTELGDLAHRVVNVVALHVNQRAVDQTVRELNLTREYVEAKIQNEQARKGGAAIAWVRSFVRGTTLQQFGAGPRTLKQPVNWSNDQILAMGKKFGRWPGWTRRTGDQFGNRNIPPNYKSRGIAVQIKRTGGEGVIDRGFIMPLRRRQEAGGNGYGVFARDKSGVIKHRYGPSVYQTFRRYITDNSTPINEELLDEFNTQLGAQILEFER